MDPSHIMQVGMGFWASKALLSAVELELFTALGKRAMTAKEIAQALALHPRAVPDFPDALVALHLLAREGNGPGARYSNTPEGALFLDKNSPAYIGGILVMANQRLYRFWGDLTEALKTGAPQNEIKHGGEAMFAELYDFSKYETLCDVGGATGQLACMVAAAHRHMQCTSFDLPKVEPIAMRRIAAAGLSGQVKAVAGDFFTDALPKADVITMGMILHDWNLEKKKILIRKAYEALPPGGAFVVIEALIDDARRENDFGLLMSLNMLIEFGDAFDYSGADFVGWCKEAGFREFEVIPLAGPSSAAVVYK